MCVYSKDQLAYEYHASPRTELEHESKQQNVQVRPCSPVCAVKGYRAKVLEMLPKLCNLDGERLRGGGESTSPDPGDNAENISNANGPRQSWGPRQSSGGGGQGLAIAIAPSFSAGT